MRKHLLLSMALASMAAAGSTARHTEIMKPEDTGLPEDFVIEPRVANYAVVRSVKQKPVPLNQRQRRKLGRQNPHSKYAKH